MNTNNYNANLFMNGNIPVQKPSLAATALGGLIAGVITGATVAAASNARKVKNGCITKQEAAQDIAREAGTMGIAASVGVSATAILGASGLLSVASTALLTAGTKYALDSLLLPDSCDLSAIKEKAEAQEEGLTLTSE